VPAYPDRGGGAGGGRSGTATGRSYGSHDRALDSIRPARPLTITTAGRIAICDIAESRATRGVCRGGGRLPRPPPPYAGMHPREPPAGPRPGPGAAP